MSISEAKLEANRENAQKSSGPTSRAGRARAAQNAIKHGLCSKFFVLESENQDEYNALLQRFIDAEKPIDDVEYELVAKMARSTWMSERAVRCQNACFQHHPQTDDHKAESKQNISVREDLDKYLRYQTTHDRAYARAAAELAKRRVENPLSSGGRQLDLVASFGEFTDHLGKAFAVSLGADGGPMFLVANALMQNLPN
jgi:hypothetical protein